MKSIHSTYLKLVFSFALFIGGVGTSFSQYKRDVPFTIVMDDCSVKEMLINDSTSLILDDRSIKQWAAQEEKLYQNSPLGRYLKNPAQAWSKEYQQLEHKLEASQTENFKLKAYILLATLLNLGIGGWFLFKRARNQT